MVTLPQLNKELPRSQISGLKRYGRLPPLSTPLDMTPIYDEPAQVRTDPFTMQELNMILHRLKNRKAPGSDGIPSEFWKWASPYFLEVLLQHLNDCLLSASAPDTWNEALVAMLPKESSDPSHPASNRPIALTQTSYKIYAALLQRRLQQGLESRIRPHQYGFRPHKSTSQPCHIIRRILELYERQGETLHLLFLDWAKASDTISHDAIECCLHRIGVPEPMVKAVCALYAAPTFQI